LEGKKGQYQTGAPVNDGLERVLRSTGIASRGGKKKASEGERRYWFPDPTRKVASKTTKQKT